MMFSFLLNLTADSSSKSRVRIAPHSKNTWRACRVVVLEGLPNNRDFVIKGIGGETVVETQIHQLKEAWQNTFRESG